VLKDKQYKWLVTGCAGFIRSNLVGYLLGTGQEVTGIDNFSTGFQHNLDQVKDRYPEAERVEPTYREFRPGDVRHFLADIGKAEKRLGYTPACSVEQGLKLAAEWYMENL